MEHFYRDVPGHGAVAVSRHAQARMADEQIDEALFRRVLLEPDQKDKPDGQDVVWRQGHQPRVREASPGEAELLTGLLSGKTLDAVLQDAPALDFNAWLPMAVQTGLLLGARPAGQSS